nr:TolC family protein [Caulobacter sp. 17J80-11]
MAASALTACASTGDLPAGASPLPGAFARAEGGQAAQPDTAWWTALGDPTLDALVEKALTSNRDLLAAEAEVRRARALADVEAWNFLPFGSANTGWSQARDGQPPVNGEVAALGATASWEADVFGRIHAGVKAAEADALSVEEARKGALVTVAAETAAAYVDLRGAQARLAAAQANLKSQTDTLALTEKMKAAGQGTRLDVARAREQLETTRSTVSTLEAQIAGAHDALNVLVAGLTPALEALLADPTAVPAAPAQFGVGSPEDLLQRRPDIRQAEARLQAAVARRRAAKVDWWPRLTVAGGAAWLAPGFGDLGVSDGFSYSIGPRIDWPALDFRRNALREQAAQAGAEAEFHRYDQSVLSGVRDVDTGLAALSAARVAARDLDAAAAAAREAAELSRVRYRQGADPFFSVLDAERRLSEAEDRLAVARTREALAYVRLGQALGAGWQARPG